MLPDSFLDWWFAPWTYAAGARRRRLPLAADQLGQRDGYRLWCEQANVQVAFPDDFDPAWHVAAVQNANELMNAAKLFAGLIAAREHNQAMLDQLAIPERRWCMSVAITQPLKGCQTVPFTDTDSIEIRGLVELVRRVESGFPGMWTRLRLLLPKTLAARVGALLPAA
ncbi:MAG TPA: hypothetical protein VM571_14475, partial [Noviherbaspirillum sp.]|nr:hypothetical protein [Noviherbaspirillum sp.]